MKKTLQESLDKWFTVKDQSGEVIERPPNIFHMDWSDRKAQWVTEVPEQTTFKASINWKQIPQKMVVICGYVPGYESYQLPCEDYYSNVSFLKSHLQKAIRRGETALALKTCYHFMKLDLNQFLRRISIIMLEDVMLFDCLPMLVWFLAAHSKGYQLTKNQLYWLMGVVYALSECPDADLHDHAECPELNLNVLKRLPVYKKSLIFSLEFRASFGGMRGDKNMIHFLSKKWFDRFIESGSSIDIPDIKREIGFITFPTEKLELTEWILAAIDFHCVNNLIGLLVDRFEEYEYDDIKSAIWRHSSSINYRKKTSDSEYKELWSEIRKDFLQIAGYSLKNNY